MTHTILLDNKGYLALTTFTSIAVLSGIEYSSLALAVLLIPPVAKQLINTIKAITDRCLVALYIKNNVS